MTIRRWRFSNRQSGFEWIEPLHAYWEVAGDPISDEYDPNDTTSEELLALWARSAREKYPDGLVPIYWFVRTQTGSIGSLIPFQFPHLSLHADFLTEFTWPTEEATGERLRWVTLPVIDKRWNRRSSSKGGFIQEATGWKPSILQPHLFLPSLLEREVN